MPSCGRWWTDDDHVRALQAVQERLRLLELLPVSLHGEVPRYGHELAAADLQELEPIVEENCASLNTALGRQRAFVEVVSFLRDRFGWPEDPEAEAECRSIALEEANLDAFGQPTLLAAGDDALDALATPDHSYRRNIPDTVDTEERYLDAEIVAIYW